MLERLPAYCDPERLAKDPYTADTPVEELEPGQVPNVITSLLPNGRHAPVLDIDFPCAVVPSSTPGHFHLYLDRELEWWEYEHLLSALQLCGIVQRGFLEASQRRGRSVVRMPWVNKWQPEPVLPAAGLPLVCSLCLHPEHPRDTGCPMLGCPCTGEEPF